MKLKLTLQKLHTLQNIALGLAGCLANKTPWLDVCDMLRHREVGIFDPSSNLLDFRSPRKKFERNHCLRIKIKESARKTPSMNHKPDRSGTKRKQEDQQMGRTTDRKDDRWEERQMGRTTDRKDDGQGQKRGWM